MRSKEGEMLDSVGVGVSGNDVTVVMMMRRVRFTCERPSCFNLLLHMIPNRPHVWDESLS